MEAFLSRVIDGAMQACTGMTDGVVKNYADEINDMLADAQVDLGQLKAMAQQKMREQQAAKRLALKGETA
jgi:hypothetical protein